MLLSLHTQVQERGKHRGELRLMWYNVENLFYPGSDSLSDSDSSSASNAFCDSQLLNPDVDFTPEGIRRWTWKRYRAKLTAVAKVIVAAGNLEPPEVVGLCEVEEARVLVDLVNHPILEPYAYDMVHRDSRDHRGMDVACLYRKDRINLVEWSTHSPERNADFYRGTRDMLHLCFVWGKKDSLDLFLVHLVSKYGGAGATAERRRKQVDFLRQLVDSVHRQRPESLKILGGDFNESYEGYSMEPLRVANPGVTSILPLSQNGGRGSYKYRGRWSRIDLFLIAGSSNSASPANSAGSTRPARMEGSYQIQGSILQIPPLMTSDETYGGWKPYRTYEGYAYAGGVSDHLPLILDISSH